MVNNYVLYCSHNTYNLKCCLLYTSVFGILWGIIREIVNGVFRVAIGVIVAILSTIAFFGFILWLFTL